MRRQREDLFHLIEPFLPKVEHPSRYLDHEWGAEENQDGPFHVCMVYADVYEVGQPNLGIAILYRCLNEEPGISCERAYLPWKDMSALMREHGVPMLSLETASPLSSFDIVGFTLAHELIATNVIESLDLAGIALRSCDRDEDDAFVIAGGPSAWNVEPMAEMFDAVLLGDGEECIVNVARCVRDGRAAERSRAEILLDLSRVEGVYVPSLYDVVVDDTSTRWGYAVPREGTGAPEVVYKACVQDFASTDAIAQRIVPYMGIVQDRLAIEVLRGCARGCRFCQAGVTYRPVRERPAEQILEASEEGLAACGYDELSLSSLSTTDHSQCAALVRALNERFSAKGVRVSIPSQRLDSFGTEMAAAVAGSRKASLTFAPEAGTQRLRDVINKNVRLEDIDAAARNAFEQGWRRCKLYFMMGLPTETDDDIIAIAEVAERVLAIGREVVGKGVKSGVSVSISVSVFVPKPFTPFQWCGQLPMGEVRRRQRLLLSTLGHERAIRISYHDARTSVIEACLSKMGRSGLGLLLSAWEHGCVFDAWTTEFDYGRWEQAAESVGISLEDVAAEPLSALARLPWDHTSPGISKAFLRKEWRRAQDCVTTADCTREGCVGCGICPTLGVHNDIVGVRS